MSGDDGVKPTVKSSWLNVSVFLLSCLHKVLNSAESILLGNFQELRSKFPEVVQPCCLKKKTISQVEKVHRKYTGSTLEVQEGRL